MTQARFLGALVGCLEAGAVAQMALIPATCQNLGGLSQRRGGSKDQIESIHDIPMDTKLISDKAHIQTPLCLIPNCVPKFSTTLFTLFPLKSCMPEVQSNC